MDTKIQVYSILLDNLSNNFSDECKIEQILTFLNIFNFNFSEFDLYTKSDSVPDVDKLTEYYQTLIDKYIPGIVHW